MSKVSLSIRMLNILASRNVVSKEELANLLETNVRNISEYRKELLDAGYDITAIHGVGGGYSLNRENIIPSLKLTEGEKQSLLSASNYLNKRYDFMDKEEFNLALGKVLNTVNVKGAFFDTTIIDRFPLAMPTDEIKKRYDFLTDQMSLSHKAQIEYLSSKNKVKKHIIHPYKLYMYNLAWYVLAFNESINDIGYFKLNRIVSFKPLKDSYVVMKTFDIADYLDKFGMKQNGEFYDVSIMLKSPYAALVRERIYGKNQTLEFVDDDTTILNCKMQNLDMITSFVLGFGSKATVLKPEALKESVKKTIDDMKKIYSE